MKRTRCHLLFALLVLATLPQHDAIVDGQSKPQLIGQISEVKIGCGCHFHTPSRRKHPNPHSIFQSDLEGAAWMNLDGREIELRLVRTIDKPRRKNRAEKKGDQTIEEYEGSGFKVTVSQTVTRPCRPADEDCEYTRMNAVLKVSGGGREQTVRAVGGCGC